MMKRQNIRTLFLIIGTFTYLLCGASFFDYAESRHEKMQRTALNRIESMIIKKYNISQNDFRILTTVVIKNVPHKAGVQWKFSGAFYFATTVLTTIGYGHSTPATYLGKSFCMLYALMGIPLGLIMFQSIGERLNTFVAFSLRFCKRCLHFKNSEAVDTNSIPLSDKSLIISVSIISTLMMTIGAAVFSAWENWTYFDAFYYCFITLTTIGFGDYVALQKNSALQDKPEYVIFSLVFILFGLSVVSAAINLLVLRFLTMNTEDERRDEAEAALQSASGVRLEGDVITANGSILSGIGGIIPMENYLHNTSSVYPFSSRYHVYNYQTSAKDKKHFSRSKFRRTNQLDQDDLFSDREYLDAEQLNANRRQQITYYQNQESNEPPESEMTESSSQRNKAFIQKQIIISDSGSERTFNAHLNHLKAHRLEHSEASEISVSSERASNRKSNGSRRTSKVFCKTTNHLLSKQQRKNYKHMESDESEPEANSALMSEPVQFQSTDDFYEENDDRASVCSCTCYGNNQSISGWRTNKSKKAKNRTNQASETKSQTFILNRKASSKRHKSQTGAAKSTRLTSNVKYKNMKSTNRKMNQEQQFDLNLLNYLNEMQSVNQETILRPIYLQQTPYQTHLVDEFMNSPLNRTIFLNNSSIDPQLIFDKQRPYMVVQSSQLNQPDLNRLTNEALRNQLICNLNTTNELSNPEYDLNHLNAINAKNLSPFLDHPVGQLSEQQIIELNEKQFKDKFKSKDRRNKTKQNSSKYLLLKRSNGGLDNDGRQSEQFTDFSSQIRNETTEVKSDFLTVEPKQTTERASI